MFLNINGFEVKLCQVDAKKLPSKRTGGKENWFGSKEMKLQTKNYSKLLVILVVPATVLTLIYPSNSIFCQLNARSSNAKLPP